MSVINVDLTGRAAIVTGAASGIGEAIAVALASAGARVVLADLNEDAGQALAARLPGAAFQRADIASRADCHALVNAATEQFGAVDILVNNAGLQHVAPVHEFPEDTWERMIQIMLVGAFTLTRATLPGMYTRGWGRIVNIASIHGLVASPFKSAYVSAKHGLLGLTKTVALEAAEHGVTVNAICPSYVRTPLVERQIADQARIHGISEERVVSEIMLEPAAVKRLVEPDEVAAYALYLCSEMGGAITGAAQVIDCGWTAR